MSATLGVTVHGPPPTGQAELLSLARQLYGCAVALSGPGPDADDLVQDALEVLLNRWDEIRGNRIAYGRRVIANKFIDGLRHQPRHDAAIHILAADLNAQVDFDSEVATQTDLQSALAQLPERERTVAVLRYLLDYSVRDVARLLDLPAGSIRRISHEAIVALRGIHDVPEHR